MYILPKVLNEIADTIGTEEPECGGILAIDQNGVIADYYFDASAGVGKATYIPSRTSIQDFVRKHWSSSELQFCGVVHSHTAHNPCAPSRADIQMARKIMQANDMEHLYLMIVQREKCRLFCVDNHDDCVEVVE